MRRSQPGEEEEEGRDEMEPGKFGVRLGEERSGATLVIRGRAQRPSLMRRDEGFLLDPQVHGDSV